MFHRHKGWELEKINRKDIDFHERSCIVTGKGNKQREVYFDARTKLHLKQYLNDRKDNNEALFVSLVHPHKRLAIGGIEMALRKLGVKTRINKVHPRTLATMAIDKGMPIEQVQKLLEHLKTDTALNYAQVQQANVKISHRKFIS
ncbi:MAG: site-specific integrase [Niabella sp.]